MGEQRTENPRIANYGESDGGQTIRRYVHGGRLDEIIRQQNFSAGEPDAANDTPTASSGNNNPQELYFHHK